MLLDRLLCDIFRAGCFFGRFETVDVDLVFGFIIDDFVVRLRIGQYIVSEKKEGPLLLREEG